MWTGSCRHDLLRSGLDGAFVLPARADLCLDARCSLISADSPATTSSSPSLRLEASQLGNTKFGKSLKKNTGRHVDELPERCPVNPRIEGER